MATTRATDGSAFWQILEGSRVCSIADGGRCVTDGFGKYGNSERCVVKALRPLVLTTVQYEVETGFDFISVGGTAFKGESGPQGVKVETGAELVWTSDDTEFRSGFKICAAESGLICHDA